MIHAGHASGAGAAPAPPGGLNHTQARRPDLREGLSEPCRCVSNCWLSGSASSSCAKPTSTLYLKHKCTDMCCILLLTEEHDAEEPIVTSVERPGDDSSAAPERAPRQRGLWGASAKSGAASARQVLPESRQEEVALESEQASCRGTSLVGSGISMSALSSAFQVRKAPVTPAHVTCVHTMQ